MSNTEHAGVSHQDIYTAIARVRDAAPAYNYWKCVPGQWLSYTLLLAPIWFCKPKRKVRGIQHERDLTGMPTELPELPDNQ